MVLSMEKFVVIVLCLLITDQMLLAQNHVINSGFEEKYRCPTTQSQIQYSLNWGYKIVLKNSSISTPDYYHTCSNTDRLAKKWLNNMTEVGITENLNGVQPPHSGDAYAGIALFDVGPEWLQTKLKFPLKQGQKYYAEYYVSLADNENYASNALGISFSEKDICKESRKHNDLSYLGTYIQNETGLNP